jgi:RecA-family ATPase
VRELGIAYPALRPPVIHGLLREGETMNVIASPKTGKSWLTIDLALAVAAGRPWLGRFETVRGDVLIIDNELHPETSSHRIPRVAEARGLTLADIGDRVSVDNLRGRLKSLLDLDLHTNGGHASPSYPALAAASNASGLT